MVTNQPEATAIAPRGHSTRQYLRRIEAKRQQLRRVKIKNNCTSKPQQLRRVQTTKFSPRPNDHNCAASITTAESLLSRDSEQLAHECGVSLKAVGKLRYLVALRCQVRFLTVSLSLGDGVKEGGTGGGGKGRGGGEVGLPRRPSMPG